MIPQFYPTIVPSVGQMQGFVPVSNALSDEQVLPHISEAFETYIVPVVGREVADALLEKAADETVEGEWRQAVHLAQKAAANLCFWAYFSELNTHITDQGFQRQESESFKGVYRYQELDLRQTFKNKGFNAVDQLVMLLINAKMEGYKTMPAWVEWNRSIAKSIEECERYVYINKSVLVFLMLLRHIRKVMDVYIHPVLGEALWQRFIAWLETDKDENSDELSEDSQEDEKLMEALRYRVLPVVLLHAAAIHVRDTGSLTDRGLYYIQSHAVSGETQEEVPTERSERSRQASEYHRFAKSYMNLLMNWIEANLPEVFGGRPQDALKRDNDHKRAFWA